MTNLVEQILKMEAGESDAIIYQFKNEDKGLARPFGMHAIIRRINTLGGRQWVFNQLYLRCGMVVSGSGMYGDINDVVRDAERTLGKNSEVSEWVLANYTDPSFPPNLII